MTNGFYYLAIPYKGTPEEQAARTELSLAAAAECLRQGIHLFAPIIYVNKIADKLSLTLDQRRDKLMPYLFDFLKVSKGLLLVTADGWQDSWGVRQELLFCLDHHIPVFKLSTDQLYPDLSPSLETPLSQKEVEDLLR